ncbi:cyclase [Streptomyces sp. DH-12]|uniref:aromatase/cyclase n=1 Tax=unclassified Streptomyces TaxID=2593676 RepID=UPI000CCDE170|nr:SRPBCC family protein [Streptomyces sp. DH-12]PNV30974.1 cyclase [Streptomyces sp. DH-12]
MAGERVHRIAHETEIAAPAGVVYGLIADAGSWPLFLPPAVHVELLDFETHEERIRAWATVDGAVRCWISRRVLDPERRRIDFRYDPAPAPARMMRGDWHVEERGPHACRLVLRHEYAVPADLPGEAARTGRVLAAADAAVLERLRELAERWTELDRLVFSFQDEIRVKGPAELVYDFLYRVGEWPGVVPHVVRTELAEEEPGVQHVTMDVRGADGVVRPTESVRVCFPHAGRLVHKQTRTPPMVAARTGEWQVVPDTRGVLVVCHQTVLVRAEEVEPVLGPGAGLPGARRRLRTELGREALDVLDLARRHAENAVEVIHLS